MCPLNDNCSCHEAEDDYGTCAVCGQYQRLTTRGNLYQHQRRNEHGTATGEQCAGAGKPPKDAPNLAKALAASLKRR